LALMMFKCERAVGLDFVWERTFSQLDAINVSVAWNNCKLCWLWKYLTNFLPPRRSMVMQTCPLQQI
jgi:hypothetical protein